MIIGIIGSGAMGSGIAQVAAMAGCEVRIYDSNRNAISGALENIRISVNKFADKAAISHAQAVGVMGRIFPCDKIETLEDSDLIIEAIIEDLQVKKEIFRTLEKIVSEKCIIATNTSSLSVTSIASALNNPGRCCGIHFFNPPVLMRLVEVIPAAQTNSAIINTVRKLIESWGKTAVIARDTPGFIVNKVARPFYSEAIRIMEEGKADIYSIDKAMTFYGFKMGPFTLMDFIGHDVNYKVTESVWKSFYYDTRYKPSLSQLRLLEAGYLGKKSGRGFYNYVETSDSSHTSENTLYESIFMRIISMMINEAADTVWQNICSADDLDMAVKLGVNYPKGLFEWGKEIGYGSIVVHLDELYTFYHEERYRVCPYLKNLAKL